VLLKKSSEGRLKEVQNMRSFHILRSGRPYVWVGCAVVTALVTGVGLGMTLSTNDAEAQAGRTFGGGAGLMLNYVKADSTAQFEAVMGKLGEALQTSDNAQRNQQGEGWKVYRAQEPGQGGSVLYVWFIDPTVSGADYAVSAILNEAFPAEVQGLYEQFSESFAGGQVMVNLDLVADF
jgi:hypothetical protein